MKLPHWRIQIIGSRKLTNWSATGVFVPCWRLYWCKEHNKAWIRSRNGLFKLAPDRYVMIAPNTYIEAGLDAPVHHMWFHFDGGVPYDSLTNWTGAKDLSEDAVTGAVRLADEIADTRENDSYSLTAWTAEVISCGMRCVPDSLLRTAKVDARINDALHLMRKNLWLSPSVVAKRLHVSDTTLNRLFRHHLGLTPGRVLNLLRLERARHLLLATDNNLETIAYICGYCDRYHLTHRFREAYETGPAGFRKENPQEYKA